MRMEQAYILPFPLNGYFGVIYLLVTVRIICKFGFVELFDGRECLFLGALLIRHPPQAGDTFPHKGRLSRLLFCIVITENILISISF